MSEAVILKRNGQLIYRYWFYDRKKKRGYYRQKRVSPTASMLHDKNCELEKGITLREIFKFLNKNLYYWDILLGNWCKEIVTEGLTKPLKKKEEEKDSAELLYLELYRHLEIEVVDKHHTLPGLTNKLHFHGIGQYICTPQYEDWVKKGDKVNIAIEFTPANELAQYEVKVSPTFELWFWDYNNSISKKTLKSKLKNPRKYYPHDIENKATLFDVLYGIMWELSFNGSPKKRTKKLASLKKTMRGLNKLFNKKANKGKIK